MSPIARRLPRRLFLPQSLRGPRSWLGSAGAVLTLLVPLAPLGSSACSGGTKTAVNAPGPNARAETFDHERCDSQAGEHVQSLDTNGDGKPDISRVFDSAPGDKGARELCRVVDLNHDGRPDLYEYFDDSGVIRRREYCYGDAGVVNAIELYQGGKLLSRVYDTTGQHKIDTWDWFDPNAPVDAKTGRPSHPVRRERDLTGAGMVTQWWTWSGDKVTIATDGNGSGKPDPASVIVLGDDAGVPASGDSTASVQAGDGGAAPLATPADASRPVDGAGAEGTAR